MSREPFKKLRFWALGARDAAMRKLASTLDLFHVVNRSEKPGDRQGNMRGVPAGWVAWPVRPDTHDGCSFIASPCFFAEYDAEKKQAWCLDDIGGFRHPGAEPLKLGENIEVLNGKHRSGKGVVYRTAEYGTRGMYKNVFVHADGDLISHHRAPRPPRNSSMVRDPGEGKDDWAGGLHYPLRVRAFIAQWCQHKQTSSESADPLYAPLFNMTRNGDGTVAHGAATWGRGEGHLSDEAKGPLAPCDDGNRHLVGVTGTGRRVYEGGLNITTTKHGDPTAGIVYSPNLFDLTPYEPASRGPFLMETPYREDLKLNHATICNGQQPGMKRWESYSMFTEWGPPPRQPEDPPPKQPPPRQPEEPPIDAPPAVTPPEYPGLPKLPDVGSPGNKGPRDGSSTSAATPAEVEAPSSYAHPLPTGPEKPDLERRGRSAHENYWLSRYGVTEKEFAESAVTGHAIATAVHESATANDKASGANRWPQKRSQDAIVICDQQGRVIAREQPAQGPGGITFAAAGVEKDDLHTVVKPIPGPAGANAFNDFSLGVFGAADEDGVEVAKAEIGIGSRKPDYFGIIKGVATKLDFTRLLDKDNPDAIHTIRDEEGNDSTLGFHQFKQPIALPEVSTPATPASGTGVIYMKSDGKAYAKNDSGTEHDLTASGGSGDMLADGSVAMTGTLDTDGNDIDMGGGDLLDCATFLRAMLTSDATSTSNTLANTALSVPVSAGARYMVEMWIHNTTSGAMGVGDAGLNIDFDGGTATVTSMNLVAERTFTVPTALEYRAVTTALATDVGIHNAAEAKTICYVRITGYIHVDSAGTFIPRYARQAGSGSEETTLKEGTWLRLTKI